MERTSEAFLRDAFYELEIDRSAQHYGNLVHAFSTYESYRSLEEGTEPFARGINSFQLLYKDDRWWIMTISGNRNGPAYRFRLSTCLQASKDTFVHQAR